MTNPTSNYNFQMPTSTDLVTDLPADFEVFGQAVDTRLKALQPGTTLGDLAYSSATANTNTILGIGTTGQLLTVTGGVPVWAAPPSSGGMTVIASGSLSGTQVSLTSIPGTYKNLELVVLNYFFSGVESMAFRFNTNTSSIYSSVRVEGTNASAGTGATNNASQLDTNLYVASTQQNNICILQLAQYADSSFKLPNNYTAGDNTAGNYIVSNQAGVFKNTTAITSIQIRSQGGSATFAGGTYILYGVN